MSGWLRNIQGQLTDLANEVLNEASDVLTEAREEVPDPDGEIIVAKKKCAEAEKQLAIESARVESLNSEKQQLEQQLYDAHVEMDAIGSKLNGMVKQRDDEIKKLKNQMEHLQESGWHETTPISFPSATVSSEITELRQQIAHWKSKAESTNPDSENMITLTEMEQKIEALRQKKEHEIQAIVESHADAMVEMREMYEEKIQNMQILPYNASSSTSNADTLDAVLLEKEDLLGGVAPKSSTRSTNGSDGDERPVVVDLGSHDELVDERIRQMEHELEALRDEKVEIQTDLESKLSDLQKQNQELATAYTELNNDYEEFKTEHNATVSANTDLNRRIDSLKANLIEYEERYELCKKESAETVAQLERLSNDFARLRTGVANVSQRREDCDSMVNEEVEKLRTALDESRKERERLRDDVAKFTVAVGEIDTELEKLRGANRQLLEENNALTENLARYDETMKSIISSSEEDIGKFRDQFKEIQENHKQQKEAMNTENDALREETEAIKRQRDILLEESALLKEVNEKLKHKTTTEEEKNRLLTEKAELLQQCLDQEREEHAVEKKKHEEETKQKMDEIMKVLPAKGANLGIEMAIVQLQLKEALDANSEKTDECEKLQVDNRNLEREVDLRQNCVDEMIAQTNTLQMQQETMSTTNKQLQTQNLAMERQIVQLEEKLAEEKEKSQELEKKTKRLEEVITGVEEGEDLKLDDQEDSEGVITSSEEKKEEMAKLKRYCNELQTKLSSVEEELKILKEQSLSENTEHAQVRQQLERNLYEAEEVDRELLDGIEHRVKEMEEQLKMRVDQVDQLKAENSKLENMKKELTEELQVAIDMKEKGDYKIYQMAIDHTDRIEKLQQELEQSKTVAELGVTELRTAMQELKMENEELKIAAQSSTDHQSSKIVQLEADLQATVTQKLQLEEEIEQSKTVSELGLSELRSAMQELKMENEELKIAAQSSTDHQSSKIVQLEADLQATVTQKLQLEEEIEQSKTVSELGLLELRSAMQELKEENEELKIAAQKVAQLETDLQDTVTQKLQLEEQIEQSKVAELHTTIQTLKSENENLKSASESQQQQPSDSESSTIEELRAAILALQQENEHLKGVAKAQYDENVKYYEQFQAMATHNQQIQDQLTQNNQENEKRAKELQRLREHLMIVEENSTREAVEAEQRETELRERVKSLETRGHQVEEGATESNQQYQVQIVSLSSQLESTQKTSNQWKAKFESEMKAREQTQEALTSLQNVVRELSIDHERDSATASHRNLELQTMIGTLTEEIAQIREEMDRQSIGRQAAEEESDRRQLQLESKQKIIEDLELQIEELRAPKKSSSDSSYRIDDSTLRQLFLTYFQSDSTKRPDIAMLLANILEYPGEEMEKFKTAVRQSCGQQSGSSSFWGLRSSPGPSSSSSPSPGGSIADQFIRFLETESESSRTAPHLPLRALGNEPAPRMSMDGNMSSRSSNPQHNQASASSSAAALDSLLR